MSESLRESIAERMLRADLGRANFEMAELRAELRAERARVQRLRDAAEELFYWTIGLPGEEKLVCAGCGTDRGQPHESDCFVGAALAETAEPSGGEE